MVLGEREDVVLAFRHPEPAGVRAEQHAVQIDRRARRRSVVDKRDMVPDADGDGRGGRHVLLVRCRLDAAEERPIGLVDEHLEEAGAAETVAVQVAVLSDDGRMGEAEEELLRQAPPEKALPARDLEIGVASVVRQAGERGGVRLSGRLR